MTNATIMHSAGAGQAGILKAFADGKMGGVPTPADRIETHLNYIFLAGDRAYKVKRNVRMPFVDFSTVEARRAACEAELAVNRRFGSPFYLGVEPIVVQADGALRLGGEGAVADWTVIMKRFDRAGQFDNLARTGRLTVALVEEAAERIAGVHAMSPAVQQAGHAADYRQIIHRLRLTETDGAGRIGLSASHASPYDQLDAELSRIGSLLAKRRSLGKVRRTHGDLHLRNICVFEGKATPFDALEFDERLATTDVLYDLAFLLMDLRHNDLPRLANAAMNRYWDTASEDEEALELIPFFMSLRAAVRMAIAVEAGQLEEAERYRELAIALLKRAPASCIAIGGLSGSGKSAVAFELAPVLPGPAGGRILRTDVLRKRAAGLSMLERAPPAAYAPENREAIYQVLLAHTVAARRAGASVVLDGTFASDKARDLLRSGADDKAFHCFWLEAPCDVRRARVASRIGDASDADVSVALNQQDPGELGEGWRRVDAQRPPDAIVAQILEIIS